MESGEELVIKLYPDKENKFCRVCYDAKKSYEEYSSHYVKDIPGPEGKVTCPMLLSQACRYCGEVGHTVKYCKKIEEKENKELDKWALNYVKNEIVLGNKKFGVPRVVFENEEEEEIKNIVLDLNEKNFPYLQEGLLTPSPNISIHSSEADDEINGCSPTNPFYALQSIMFEEERRIENEIREIERKNKNWAYIASKPPPPPPVQVKPKQTKKPLQERVNKYLNNKK